MQPPPPASAISQERAQEVFADLASQREIVFGYLDDGCHARAHLMVRRLLGLGLVPRKVWTIARGPEDRLWVNPQGRPGAVIAWDFHLAPTLAVEEAGGAVRELVFDPALFGGPVAIEAWADAQHDTPRVIRTALGEPPVPEWGGSGYWPLPDPERGIDNHARAEMERAKDELSPLSQNAHADASEL